MEHHKCKLFKIANDELYDDQVECWFEIVTREFGIRDVKGVLRSSKLLIKNVISSESEYLMVLDDGRKGKIIITNITSDDPRSVSFELSGALE